MLAKLGMHSHATQQKNPH